MSDALWEAVGALWEEVRELRETLAAQAKRCCEACDTLAAQGVGQLTHPKA